MSRLIGPEEPLGRQIIYELRKESYEDSLSNWSVPEDVKRQISRILKKDLVINKIVEELHDAILYYIQIDGARRDDLVYVECDNKIFHGEKEWSQYHGFLAWLGTIHVSETIHESCWYVGSKDNYTHQLVDCLPNLLVKDDDSFTRSKHCTKVYCSNNSILRDIEGFARSYYQGGSILKDSIFLDRIGEGVSRANTTIRAIRFKHLYLVKHLSICKAFELLKEFFGPCKEEVLMSKSRTGLNGYFSRDDGRVQNNIEVIERIKLRGSLDILTEMHRKDFRWKVENLKEYQTLIMPPGSDNINALCFSSSDCTLIQMIAQPLRSSSSPFYSFATLRYLLPFLGRTLLVEAKQQLGLHQGIWDAEEIASYLE